MYFMCLWYQNTDMIGIKLLISKGRSYIYSWWHINDKKLYWGILQRFYFVYMMIKYCRPILSWCGKQSLHWMTCSFVIFRFLIGCIGSDQKYILCKLYLLVIGPRQVNFIICCSEWHCNLLMNSSLENVIEKHYIYCLNNLFRPKQHSTNLSYKNNTGCFCQKFINLPTNVLTKIG